MVIGRNCYALVENNNMRTVNYKITENDKRYCVVADFKTGDIISKKEEKPTYVCNAFGVRIAKKKLIGLRAQFEMPPDVAQHKLKLWWDKD